MASLMSWLRGLAPDLPIRISDERVLAEDTYAVVVGGGHALGARATASNLSELDDLSLGGGFQHRRGGSGWARSFTDQGLTPPQPTIASDSYLFIKSVLGEGDFIAVLPRDVISAAESPAAFSVSDDRWRRVVAAGSGRDAGAWHTTASSGLPSGNATGACRLEPHNLAKE